MTQAHLLQNGWVKAKDFSEMYNLSKDTVYANKSLNDNPHIKKFGTTVYVDLKSLRKRREFYHNVWLEATENYYILIDGSTQFKLATVFSKYLGGTPASWTVWMDNVLFSTAYNDRSLLTYKVSKKLWEFWRFTRWMIKIIKRKKLNLRVKT